MNRLVLGCVHSLIYLVLAIKHCKLYHPCMHALHILVLVLTMQTQIAYCKIWFMYGHYTLYDERWGNPIGLVCLGMIIYFCMHDERQGNPTSSKILGYSAIPVHEGGGLVCPPPWILSVFKLRMLQNWKEKKDPREPPTLQIDDLELCTLLRRHQWGNPLI